MKISKVLFWIIRKFWMMRPGFRLFTKIGFETGNQNTWLHKSKEGFWVNM